MTSYRIYEEAEYWIEANSAQEAIDKYLGPKGITCSVAEECRIIDRAVYDVKGNWCETTESYEKRT